MPTGKLLSVPLEPVTFSCNKCLYQITTAAITNLPTATMGRPYQTKSNNRTPKFTTRQNLTQQPTTRNPRSINGTSMDHQTTTQRRHNNNGVRSKRTSNTLTTTLTWRQRGIATAPHGLVHGHRWSLTETAPHLQPIASALQCSSRTSRITTWTRQRLAGM